MLKNTRKQPCSVAAFLSMFKMEVVKMYHVAALLLFPFLFGLAIAIPVAIWEGLKKWFNSPSKRRERAYFSQRFRDPSRRTC